MNKRYSKSPETRTAPDNERLFDRVIESKYKTKSSIVLEIEDFEKSPTPLKDEEEISTFTFEDACGPARPEKIDVAPESDRTESGKESGEMTPEAPKSERRWSQSPPTPTTPVTPDFADAVHPLDESMSEDEDDEPIDKYSVTPEPEHWDALSDEEKKLHKQAIEQRKQRRRQEAISKLPVYYPGLHGCQHIAEYSILNTIAAGTYGEVFRGRHTRTDEIVALKRFKMEKEKDGFPITALREINMLLKAGGHENIVNVMEILVGHSVNEVYLAMEYVEHDVKSLIDKMKAKKQKFRTGEQKAMMFQLLSGMEHLHNLWILHRDLKTANLLISHSGILKIADFGLAREFGEARDIEKRLKLTPVVVTLWYRSPELLMEPKTYSTPVDMWSIGCIMAEFITMEPFFKGHNEPTQVDLIFRMMGTPNEKTWPTIKELKVWNTVEFNTYKPGNLKKYFRGEKLLSETGFDFLKGMLEMDPSNRMTASEALNHPWFSEHPKAVPYDQLPTFPAKSELNAPPPRRTQQNRLEALLAEEDPERAALLRQFNVKANQVKSSDFQLKF